MPLAAMPSGALRLALPLLLAASVAQAEERGQKVFQYCFSCHSIEPGETDLQGPNLRGIVGRPIAATEGFDYSPALRAFAQRNDRWSETLLDRYLAAPEAVVPRTSMAFRGVDDASERNDLIAYLRSTGAPP
jgi:cytochrome c